jgi:hypothetical protein
LQKCLIAGLEQEIYKMSPEHLIVPERKDMLKNKINKAHSDGDMSEGNRNQLKELPMAQTGAL